MTTFFRLMNSNDKPNSLLKMISDVAEAAPNENSYVVNTGDFFNVPGSPFSYWVSSVLRSLFKSMAPLCNDYRDAQHGGSTKDDFRYLRLAWEVDRTDKWYLFAKGGEYSKFYADVYLCVNWARDAYEIEADLLNKYPYLGDDANWVLHRECKYFQPGLTWTSRTTSGLGMRILPENCLFSSKGPAVFVEDNDPLQLLALQAVLASSAFSYLLSVQLAAADSAARSYEVGLLQKTPVPDLTREDLNFLASKSEASWALKRTLDTIVETSHSFILPLDLIAVAGKFNRLCIEKELAELQLEIDDYCFELYRFSDSDKKAALGEDMDAAGVQKEVGQDGDIKDLDGILSWCVGVAFGRFDWRMATGERELPPIPKPFSPLPEKSIGMLHGEDAPFFQHDGVLVEDRGSEYDLGMIVGKLLTKVGVDVEVDVHRWLKKDFFKLHLKNYTKSRRQAPIYWPLQTLSGSYTLWIYYPRIDEQTLFTCVNDFIDPKLERIEEDIAGLRSGSSRSVDAGKELASLSELSSELKSLRDDILAVSSYWNPNVSDGVQITAAPLWKIFQNKPWKNKLKKTWQEMKVGKYDWSHMSLNFWPERVLKKCHQDRSISIAHGVEADLWEEVEVAAARGRGTKLAWKTKDISEADLDAYIQQKIAQG